MPGFISMHVFLYEWITGGGLVEQGARLPASLLAEGTAMIEALAADFAALDGAEVSVLRDLRLHELSLPECDVVEVSSTLEWRREFDRLAAAADWSLVIAPEFDCILVQTLERLAANGAQTLNASVEFASLASDKQQTAERLRAAGVSAPAGRCIVADALKLPLDFPYPGVLKPIDGAGSQHTLLVTGAGDEPLPYPWPRRLEQFCPGRAASVAALCGPAGQHMLPPCWQHLSEDGRFTYRGGASIREAELAQRATALAARALAAMPPAHGYIGVDLVLGEAPDGGEDVVIEINPRPTTSYVGLRAMVKENLAQAMLNAAAGRGVVLTPAAEAAVFWADGGVWTV